MNLIKYNSTPQFREVLKRISHWAHHHGKPMPTLIMSGTVKLHGTNAAVVFSGDELEDMHCQSRERIIVPGDDNAGFAAFVHGTKGVKEELKAIALRARKLFGSNDPVQIIGEWVGPGIQKGVAISEIAEKTFVVFRIRVSKDNEAFTWAIPNHELMDAKHGPGGHGQIRAISAFPYALVRLDFALPAEGVNAMTKVTEEIDAECPVAKELLAAEGKTAVCPFGEGLVWDVDGYVDADGNIVELTPNAPGPFEGLDLRSVYWKTKGQSHTSSNVRVLVPMDVEKQKSKEAFVEYACTENRLNQGIKELEAMGKPLDMTSTGDFIGWVVRDITKEELETMTASGLEPKSVNGQISQKAKMFWVNYLNNLPL